MYRTTSQSWGFQTPFFVTQADFTDIFCQCSPEMMAALKPFLEDTSLGAQKNAQQLQEFSITDAVIREAMTYCSEEEVLTAISDIPQKFRQLKLADDLAGLYDLTVHELKDANIPSPDAIGRWIDENKANPPYFAQPTKGTRTVSKRVLKESV